MRPDAHRIRRQSWRVAVRSAPEAFAARARLRAGLEHELPLALERALDSAAPTDALVHIPRLELRLRLNSLDALAEKLAEALGEALERALPLQETSSEAAPAGDRLAVLLEYLDTGTLAWHAAQNDAPVAAAALRASAVENLETVARRGPAPGAAFEAAALFYFRLLALMPIEKWAALERISISRPFQAIDASAVIELMRTALHRDVEADREALLDALAAPVGSRHETLARLAALPAQLRSDARRIAAVVLAASRRPAPIDRARSFAAPASKESVDSFRRTRGASGASAPEPSTLRPDLRTAALSLPDDKRGPGSQMFALMAGNAGLVLLHPFLPSLFEACDLHRQGRLVELQKAAALLHWLATGRDEVHEFELAFVKVLLGLRPETPLAAGEGLVGERERQEGEALLAAAIGHWKALGKSSADALRVAFLQRRGALREEESGWRMQPEPQSYDVLLGRLPWGLATVELPWMTRPLYTDWPTP